MGIFSSTKRPEHVIFFRKQITGFYDRVLVRSWEFGYEVRNGMIYPFQTGVHVMLKAPWSDVEILIVDGADFPVQVTSILFMENYQIHVYGTVYGRIINATSLLQTVHNPSDTEIKSLITTACENSLLGILSTFNTYLQVEQTGRNLSFDIQPQVAYLTTRGLTITDLRITHVDLPKEIQQAIHATATSEHTARQIQNIEREIGKVSQKYGYGYLDRTQMRGGEGAARPLNIADVLSVLMLGQFVEERPRQIPVIDVQSDITDEEERDDGPRIIWE